MLATTKTKHLIYIFTVLPIAFMLAYGVVYITQHTYVSSKHSDYCYKFGDEHGNMELINKRYYSTLLICNKPLK